jgi:hypothetical protein
MSPVNPGGFERVVFVSPEETPVPFDTAKLAQEQGRISNMAVVAR